MSKQKIYFITYGDDKFKISKKHLIGLAKYSNLFDECISYGPQDLDKEFVKKYKIAIKDDSPYIEEKEKEGKKQGKK